MMQRKGSYFFVIDAFIGSIIITAAIIIATTQFSAKSINTVTYYSAEDFLSIQETTQIRDYGYTTKTSDSSKEDEIHRMVKEGVITNTQNTLLQQIVIFYEKPDTNSAINMTEAIVDNTPTSASIEVYITVGGTTTLLAKKTRIPYADANSIVSSQRIIVAKKSPTEMYPPAIIEVRTWQ